MLGLGWAGAACFACSFFMYDSELISHLYSRVRSEDLRGVGGALWQGLKMVAFRFSRFRSRIEVFFDR